MSEACEVTLLRTLIAIYSASMVLKVTNFCFLLHQETMEKFMVEHQLDVLFRSTVIFALFESAYLVDSSSLWRHISSHIQQCLVYILIHVLLLSSESVSIDS
jgi:hypothetical protein